VTTARATRSILPEQIRLRYEQPGRSAVANLINDVILCLLLGGVLPFADLAFWYTRLVMVNVPRYPPGAFGIAPAQHFDTDALGAGCSSVISPAAQSGDGYLSRVSGRWHPAADFFSP